MIQTTIKYRAKYAIVVSDAMRKILCDDPFCFISDAEDVSDDRSITIKTKGYLHSELVVCRLRSEAPEVEFRVSGPEVVFLQPMSQVVIEYPHCASASVMGVLSTRIYNVCDVMEKLDACVSVPDGVPMARCEVRMSVLMTRNLMLLLRNRNHLIKVTITDGGEEEVSELTLREELDRFGASTSECDYVVNKSKN